jgi:hypothetical protein
MCWLLYADKILSAVKLWKVVATAVNKNKKWEENATNTNEAMKEKNERKK